jgi:hypothetical protein
VIRELSQHGHGRDWYGRVDEPPQLIVAGMPRKRCGANPYAEIIAEGVKIPQGPIPRSNTMSLIDWRPFVIIGNTMPPRDPDEDEEDEDEDEPADEPPVVREPDED